MVLEQRHEDSRRSQRGVVECVRKAYLSVRTTIAKVRPPGLPVMQGRTAVGLAVFTETGYPAFNVVHTILAEPHVAGGGLDNLIRHFEFPQQAFGQIEQPRMPLRR